MITGADKVRVVLAGEVDADLAPDLQEATTAVERSGLPTEVDTHHVTFMDSSGVAFLARLATRSPYRVRMLHVPPTVRFLLDVTRIDELLDVVEDGEVDVPTPVHTHRRRGGGGAADVVRTLDADAPEALDDPEDPPDPDVA